MGKLKPQLRNQLQNYHLQHKIRNEQDAIFINKLYVLYPSPRNLVKQVQLNYRIWSKQITSIHSRSKEDPIF